jgi:hypothetical protein
MRRAQKKGPWPPYHAEKHVCVALVLLGLQPGVNLVRDLHTEGRIGELDWPEIRELLGDKGAAEK